MNLVWSTSGGKRPPLALWPAALTLLGMACPAHAADNYPQRTDWTTYSGGSLNISVFIFRDSNRNGLYDLGDHPMSGIRVDGKGLGRPIWSVSNGAGFANFNMSGTQADAAVMFEGEYEFAVQLPAKWSATTANASQTTVFEVTPGSPADMTANPAPSLVGLAPDLWLYGSLPDGAERSAMIGPDDQNLALEADEHHFAVPIAQGSWHSASDATRVVALDRVPVQISEVWWTSSARAGADTVTFDDLQSEGVAKIPSGYGGLGWDNFVMTHRKFYDPEGYRNGVMSGEFLAYNGSGHPAAIVRDKPFDFVGGYFGLSTLEAEGEKLLVTAWRGGERAYQEEMTLSALGPTYLAADFLDITRLEFRTGHFWQFTVDDLSFVLP